MWRVFGLIVVYTRVNQQQEKLRQRVGEHATRLQRQEAGLKTYLESVQRLQTEETKLLVSIARLSKEKTDLLSRAGSLEVGDGGGDSSGYDEGGDGGGRKGEGIEELGQDGMRVLLRQKEQSAAEMEREKDRLQARCRELQVGNKGQEEVTADVPDPCWF